MTAPLLSSDVATTSAGAPRATGSRALLSLRLRFTLAVVLIAALLQSSIALVVGFLQYTSVDTFFNRRVEIRLERMAAAIVRAKVTAPDAETFRKIEHDSVGLGYLDRISLWLLDRDGNVLSSTGSTAPSAVRENASRAVRAGRVQFFMVPGDDVAEASDSDPWRAGALPFRAADGSDRCIALAFPNDYAAAMNHTVFQAIAGSLVVGVLTAGLASWLVAARLLKPLGAVERWARDLHPDRLGRSAESGPDPLADAPTVAELDRVRDELRITRDRLREMFAAQERFLSNAAHELKTPIAVLLTEAQTLPTANMPAAMTQFVKSTSDEMTRLGRVIESFLLLTKIRAGKAESHVARHGANDLAMAAIHQSRLYAEQQKVRLVAQLASEAGLDAYVCGDDALLETMLDNLLRNAIRFSPEGGTVTVEIHVLEHTAEFIVRDEGPGIAADVAERLFERFAQAMSETKRGRGTGLGLAIAQGIAELHGGVIRFRNLAGGGCEFTATLPLDRAHSGAPALPLEVLSSTDATDPGRSADGAATGEGHR
ncbi:MAG: HAMP domain-containing sensor histidine kinase [Phycisphaerales bacterium]